MFGDNQVHFARRMNVDYPYIIQRDLEKYERHTAMKTWFMFAIKSKPVEDLYTIRFYFRLPNAWMSIDQDFLGGEYATDPDNIRFYDRDASVATLTPWNEDCWRFCRPSDGNKERVISAYLTMAAVYPR